MCNCVKEAEDKYKEFYLKQHPESAPESVNVYCDCIALIFGKNGGTRFSIPFSVTDTTKSARRPKVKKINVLPQYCPFCGEKREESDLNEEGHTSVLQ
ncbi:MAG: hypothetical protein K0R00_98 [Herbinix sp.]|jgi:hypothetical protein|nr:hypothetical protein [Herbinix sp.]